MTRMSISSSLIAMPKIGEPRLDSGMALEGEQRPPLDIWAPLLPQEICWIIDRSFSYEVGFFSIL
jgi:hypothetical protein